MKLILMLASLALFCAGIPATASAAEGEEDYQPLEVGLVWTADVTTTAPSGKVLRGIATREIIGTKEIDGKTYFISVTNAKNVPGITTFTTYQRKQPDGIYTIRESDPEKKEFLEMPLPLVLGKLWDIPAEKGKLTFHIENLEAVQVGTTSHKNCFKISYRSDAFEFSSTYYLAPGIGNVMEQMKVGSGTMVFSHKSLVKKDSGTGTETTISPTTSTGTTTPETPAVPK
ncbi:hypothetical protein [Roseimicrobium sp. ORNL1]|uniref:hypothetical protein n=1 Tax=Roseimicrobium sp. ORNL1 TaxID=2711231 RepID=UPI0013E19506|nr:hypothetical protein [Roseimicrobium sp. ORNL1]QIF05818.1 hypothetical protein G5S37_31440 [Roseimicrobium sp. ORNL1]